jgi:hypothetical protein
MTFTGNNPANPANNNRMDIYAYDAAGNMTASLLGTTYVYENSPIQLGGYGEAFGRGGGPT